MNPLLRREGTRKAKKKKKRGNIASSVMKRKRMTKVPCISEAVQGHLK